MSDRLSIIVTSGTREQLQMAAMVASVGAVSGQDVVVFLSMNALAYFVKGADAAPPAEGAFGTLLDTRNAPGFKMLFESAVELGSARIHPCSMAVDVMGCSEEQLDDFLGEPLGLTKFLDDARLGQLLSF
ncbi:MAG: DsrE/DsrF/DrsH-like family protein [Ectothiorhodospiraceae bacterium]|nr:DsrE/DsrF/DrsH-like family protein [Ectothiorhodospiraceae bacterium]